MKGMLRAVCLVVAAIAAMLICSRAEAGGDSPLGQSRQMLLVLTDDWNAKTGALRAFERASADLPWRQVPPEADVMVGKNGLAWGLGLHAPQAGGPVKAEGDGRAPAGVFALSGAFGYEPLSPANPAFPFRVLTETTECVDDVKSSYYNTTVEAASLPEKTWDSSEQMRRKDDVYSLGVFVDHNADQPRPGAGSCIFLHVRFEPPRGTSGCTAMTKPNLERIVRWLDQSRRPVLVQLPRGEYERLKEPWDLP